MSIQYIEVSGEWGTGVSRARWWGGKHKGGACDRDLLLVFECDKISHILYQKKSFTYVVM